LKDVFWRERWKFCFSCRNFFALKRNAFNSIFWEIAELLTLPHPSACKRMGSILQSLILRMIFTTKSETDLSLKMDYCSSATTLISKSMYIFAHQRK
jgi:hypothetical protein